MFPCFWRSLDVITGKKGARSYRYNAEVYRVQAGEGRHDASTSPLAGSCAKATPEIKVGDPKNVDWVSYLPSQSAIQFRFRLCRNLD